MDALGVNALTVKIVASLLPVEYMKLSAIAGSLNEIGAHNDLISFSDPAIALSFIYSVIVWGTGPFRTDT